MLQVSFQSCYFLFPPRPQISSATTYFYTLSHWKSLTKFGTHAVKCHSELHAVTYALENRPLWNPIRSSTRSATSGPIRTHTHTRVQYYTDYKLVVLKMRGSFLLTCSQARTQVNARHDATHTNVTVNMNTVTAATLVKTMALHLNLHAIRWRHHILFV